MENGKILEKKKNENENEDNFSVLAISGQSRWPGEFVFVIRKRQQTKAKYFNGKFPRSFTSSPF